MSNVTIVNDEYTNIQGVAVKKIKVTRPNLNSILDESKASRVNVVVEQPKEVEFEKKVEEVKPEVVQDVKPVEEAPTYLNDHDSKTKEYNIDETALKERVAENYKNLANFDRRLEKKSEPVQKPNLNEKVANFEKLLATDVIIMQDKMDMFRKVFDEKQAKLTNAKQEQARFADSYRKTSNEEQNAKADKEVKENRTRIMNNKDHFTYLTIGENENGQIVEAISAVNESLKNLYNVNQSLYKEIIARIEKYEFDKKEINKASEKAGSEIHRYAAELSRFIDEKTPLLEDIIEVDNQYKDAQKESDRAIKDEYDAITEEENAKVGINLTIPTEQEPVRDLNQAMSIFENFRRAASEGGDEAVDINENFMNDYDEPASFRRTA